MEYGNGVEYLIFSRASPTLKQLKKVMVFSLLNI
jgi:hypothetical protein